jgi:hypothetical protein
MKKNNLKYLVIFLSLLITAGCTIKQTRTVGIMPHAKPLKTDLLYEELEETKTLSSSFRLLWLFPVTVPPNFNEAIEEAINDQGGDNLIDVVLQHENQKWIVGTIDIYHVKGKVIRYLDEDMQGLK